MANFEIPESPEFSATLRRLEKTDPAAAELFNNMFARLLENEAALLGNKTPIVNAHTLDGHESGDFAQANHEHSAEEIGLGNVNNTSDTDKPVSAAQQNAIDGAISNSKNYTDEKIAELINGAPSTLDTLKEIADAMANSEDVVEALNEAIGTKANAVHKHTKSEITDFPTSMPASDVKEWAQANEKPSYAFSEITDKPSSYTPSSHNHTASQIVTDGVLGALVVANATKVASLGTKQIRNIYFGTTELVDGSSSLPTGDIYFQFETK